MIRWLNTHKNINKFDWRDRKIENIDLSIIDEMIWEYENEFWIGKRIEWLQELKERLS